MKQTLKLSGFLLLFLLLVQDILCQSYSVKAYNPSNGLNQSQVNMMLQDKKGFYWIASREGVSRFDGVDFRNFYKSDGLVDNRITRILEKEDGTLIVVSKKGYAVLQGDRFQPFPLVPDGPAYTTGFSAVDEKDRLWIEIISLGDRKLMMIKDNSIADHSEILVLPDGSEAQLRAWDRRTGSFILQDHRGEFWAWKNENYSRIDGLDKGNVTLSYAQNPVFSDLSGNYLYTEKGLEKLDPEEEIYTIPDPLLFAYSSNDSLYLINHSRFFRIPFRMKHVFSLYVDRDRTLWVCSEEGLFKFLSFSFANFTREAEGIEKNVWSLVEDRAGHIWFGSLAGTLQRWDGVQLKDMDEFRKVNDDCFYMGGCCLYDGRILFPMGNTVLQYDRGAFSTLSFIEGQTEKVYQSPLDSSIFIGSVGQGLFVIRGDTTHLLSDLNDSGKGWVTDMAYDPDGFYWIITSGTIAKLVDDSLYIYDYESSPLRSGYVVEVDDKGNAWFGGQEGLFWFDSSGDTFRRVPLEGGMQTVNGLALMDEGKLLAGRMKDLVEIDTRKFLSGDMDYSKYYNSDNGFLGYEVQQDGIIRDREGNFWISCIDRVVRFTPGTDESSLREPLLNIVRIETMDEDRNWEEYSDDLDPGGEQGYRVAVDHLHNTINIHYRGISGYAPSQVQYRFLLEGAEQEWSSPSFENNIVLSDLKPGRHSFQVMAGSFNGLWSEAVEVRISVKPAFWQTRIFQSVAILLFTLLVVFIVLWIVKRKQRKNEQERILKKEMFDNRMNEMTRQFDPHFAFNVLNTLGMFILVGRPEDAHANLLRFSALLRKTITGYGKILIPLRDEVEFIREYCALQDTLSGGKFSYSIPDVKEGMEDFMVPRMIIHSFVENSVKHCIKPRKAGGEVTMSYESTDQYLIITITDKGKDLTEVISEKTSGTGQGTELTNNMFDLLSNFYQKSYTYEMHPLCQGEIRYGMTVVIRIPIVLESESLV